MPLLDASAPPPPVARRAPRAHGRHSSCSASQKRLARARAPRTRGGAAPRQPKVGGTSRSAHWEGSKRQNQKKEGGGGGERVGTRPARAAALCSGAAPEGCANARVVERGACAPRRSAACARARLSLCQRARTR
jgi:hypothetical protein